MVSQTDTEARYDGKINSGPYSPIREDALESLQEISSRGWDNTELL